jgi:hypothetical protein
MIWLRLVGRLCGREIVWGRVLSLVVLLHISNITKKANSTIGFIRRNLQHCPKECRKNAYISLVRSVLEFRIWSHNMGPLPEKRHWEIRKNSKKRS